MGIPARELREEVGSLLMRMLVPENPPQLVPLRRLARFLADRQDTVAWFTTNYDTTVEESALVEGLPLSTGFTDGKWTGDFGDATLRLHKLHGSLPWYSDGVLVQAGQEYGSGQLNRVGLPPLRQFLILPQRLARWSCFGSHWGGEWLWKLVCNLLVVQFALIQKHLTPPKKWYHGNFARFYF